MSQIEIARRTFPSDIPCPASAHYGCGLPAKCKIMLVRVFDFFDVAKKNALIRRGRERRVSWRAREAFIRGKVAWKHSSMIV